MGTTRREFLSKSALASAGAASLRVAAQDKAPDLGQDLGRGAAIQYAPPKKPVIVTRETGDNSIQEAYAMLERGADTLEAALHICSARENDPKDHSVGLGGLPNEDGVVELDASVMHGPTRRAGAVGAVQNIRHAAQLAQTVMTRSSQVMLVGAGAERFAVDEGFKREDLLTDDARRMWLFWKEHGNGWWGPGIDSPEWRPPAAPGSAAVRMPPRHPGPEDAEAVRSALVRLYALADRMGVPARLRAEAVHQVLWPTTGTIHVSALNARGELSAATTTSGLAWKIPGRLGDSPIIGAGCYVDPEVGAAGATGNGEENIKVAGAHTIVEAMRQGATPRQAGMEALHRIARNYHYDMTRLRYLDMIYYIVRRDGAYAGVSLWSARESGARKVFLVHDGAQRTEPCEALFQGDSLSIHPF